MARSLPIFGFVVLLALCLGVALLLTRRSTRGSTFVERTAAQHLARGRWGALALAIVALVVVAAGVGLGRGFALAPAVAGSVAMGVLALSERTVPTGASSVRAVRLEPRSATSWMSRATWVAGAVNLALLAAVVILGWVTAKPDDGGRSGRTVEWTTVDGGQSGSPWPGSYYSLPVLVALAAATLAVVAGLRLVVTRPQVNADALTELSDGDLRRRSARLFQAAYLVVMGLTLGALGLLMFAATSSIQPGSPTWVAISHWLGLAGVLAGAGSVIVGAVTGVRR